MSRDYLTNLSVAGTGPPVVLVPGMDGTGGLFYRQVPLLARSYRVATYALRDAAREMDTLVADLTAIVDAVAEGGRATLVGESFGGTLALSFALARPERVRALVVLNSFPYFAPQFRLRLASAAISAMPWGAMSIVRRATAFRMHSPHTSREDLRRFLDLTRQATRAGYLNRLAILRRYDVRAQLPHLRCPVLFVAADCDHLVPSVPQARLMASLVHGASIRILEGHGHICLIAPDVDLGHILAEFEREHRL